MTPQTCLSSESSTEKQLQRARALYLDLIKKSLLNLIYCEKEEASPAHLEGAIWPPRAQTMIGLPRLENVQFCLEEILEQKIPGDVIETGVWRGGALIFMRAILKAYDANDRVVWGADSFKGLPPPSPELYPADAGDLHHTASALAVSLDEVKENFARYDLLDDQVRFLPGWFRDTLHSAPIKQLSLIRLDGDMYESTIIALESLYPKLSKGGFLIVDDYGAVPACRQAVQDFRQSRQICDEMIRIDWTGVYWRRG
jgi:O-methyltransferase